MFFHRRRLLLPPFILLLLSPQSPCSSLLPHLVAEIRLMWNLCNLSSSLSLLSFHAGAAARFRVTVVLTTQNTQIEKMRDTGMTVSNSTVTQGKEPETPLPPPWPPPSRMRAPLAPLNRPRCLDEDRLGCKSTMQVPVDEVILYEHIVLTWICHGGCNVPAAGHFHPYDRNCVPQYTITGHVNSNVITSPVFLMCNELSLNTMPCQG